jgi:hypothetical protein
VLNNPSLPGAALARNVMTEILPKSNAQRLQVAIILALCVVLGSLLAAGVNKSNSRPAGEREWLKGEGAFFVRKNCTSCHSISAFGIKTANFGPDLSEAAVDTERRFGKSLDEFLHHPNGTMSIVLATKIPLTEAEKEEAVRLLKIAYQRKLERQARLNK